MITLRTPKIHVCEEDPIEHYAHVAATLATFFPGYSRHGRVPYPVSEIDGAWVIDSHNDWTCRVDDEDNHLVHIAYREASRHPNAESAFANWVITRLGGWTIEPTAVTSAVVSVLFDVQFPYQVDEWELGTISFEIPMESVGVFLDSKIVPGAKVTGYTTSDDIQIV